MIIAAVEKSLLLLEYMAGTGGAVSLGQIADACALPKPSAYRILGTLQEMGYVSRPPGSREYQIGPRCERLTAADPHASLKSCALPLMRKLHKKFDETVNLGVISGKAVLYLDYVETSRPLRMIATPGQSDPYFCTALGIAIASQWPEGTMAKIVEETRILRRTSQSVRTRAELLAKIRRAKELGYAEESSEAVEGVGCMAISLQPLGHPGAAISIAVPLQRLQTRRKRDIISNLKEILPGAA